jgi:hypothetical protein
MVRPAHVWFDLTQDSGKKSESQMPGHATNLYIGSTVPWSHPFLAAAEPNNILKQTLVRLLFQSAPME